MGGSPGGVCVWVCVGVGWGLFCGLVGVCLGVCYKLVQICCWIFCIVLYFFFFECTGGTKVGVRWPLV